jgi:hypothetical protein
MATNDEMRGSILAKLSGIVLVVLGFLVAAAGYRYGHSWYIGGGVALLALGVTFLVRKIINRNEPR